VTIVSLAPNTKLPLDRELVVAAKSGSLGRSVGDFAVPILLLL
jgi:hypothetical protein